MPGSECFDNFCYIYFVRAEVYAVQRAQFCWSLILAAINGELFSKSFCFKGTCDLFC